jgi:ATP/ADP translocase
MSKEVATIGILIVFFLLFGMIIYSNKGSSAPGFLDIILVFVLIAGLRAVWKKPNNNDSVTETDKHKLDKRD